MCPALRMPAGYEVFNIAKAVPSKPIEPAARKLQISLGPAEKVGRPR